jgi:protein-tyrosine-phosphatase
MAKPKELSEADFKKAVDSTRDEIIQLIENKLDSLGLSREKHSKSRWLFWGRIVNVLFVCHYNIVFHKAAEGLVNHERPSDE